MPSHSPGLLHGPKKSGGVKLFVLLTQNDEKYQAKNLSYSHWTWITLIKWKSGVCNAYQSKFMYTGSRNIYQDTNAA